MADAAGDASRLSELEESLRILEAENQELAERAEDTMLLSLLSEEIAKSAHPLEVLERGLERISILKDIPCCACCGIKDGTLVVETSFLSSSHAEIWGTPVELPCGAEDALERETMYFSGSACSSDVLRFTDGVSSFAAKSALLLTYRGESGPPAIFVFADDREEERLPGLVIMLQRAVDMMGARVDNLRLLESLRRVNAELSSANLALKQATKAKTDFLANMSHEIRTPMNAILGFSQLMRRDPVLTPQQRERLDIINRSGEYLLSLINDVLEMSKIEAGRVEITPAAFDLHALVDDLGTVFGVRAADRGIELTATCDDSVPRVAVADKAKVRQVLMNLLGNAVKFTHEGRVDLRVTARRTNSDALRLYFEVSDTGEGISADEMCALFGHFEQTRAGRESGGGTGLGLAISREYARLMGGDLTARSEEGVGSAFTLCIPAVEAEQPEAATAGERRIVRALAPDQSSYRILVADDVAEIRELLTQLLGEIGFEVRAVPDGGRAIEVWNEWRPNLILMDLRMPVLDGQEAIRRIRMSPGGAKVPIVVLTASAFVEARREVLASGANDFLGKPFDESDLLGVIGELLGARYLYEEIAGDEPTAGAESEVARAVPAELAERVRDAAGRADFDAVADLAPEVAALDAALAEQMKRLADSFDADRILELFSAS